MTAVIPRRYLRPPTVGTDEEGRLAYEQRGFVSYEDLHVGILELFAEAARKSKHFCSYVERTSFTFHRGTGASFYCCEMCGSQGENHRCVLPDKTPPEGFKMWDTGPLTMAQLEHRRAKYMARPKKTTLPEPWRSGPKCELCGARAPGHRCTGVVLKETG